MSNSRVKQKLGVVALPYTLMFMLLLVLSNISMNDMLVQFHVVVVVIDGFAGVGVAFTISHTAVTCWVCSPSPVLQSNSRVQQKLGVVALPYTSTFTLSNTAVTCWVCFPSPVLMSSITVKQKLGVVALPYTLMFMLLLLLLIGLLVLVLVLALVLVLVLVLVLMLVLVLVLVRVVSLVWPLVVVVVVVVCNWCCK